MASKYGILVGPLVVIIRNCKQSSGQRSHFLRSNLGGSAVFQALCAYNFLCTRAMQYSLVQALLCAQRPVLAHGQTCRFCLPRYSAYSLVVSSKTPSLHPSTMTCPRSSKLRLYTPSQSPPPPSPPVPAPLLSPPMHSPDFPPCSRSLQRTRPPLLPPPRMLS